VLSGHVPCLDRPAPPSFSCNFSISLLAWITVYVLDLFGGIKKSCEGSCTAVRFRRLIGAHRREAPSGLSLQSNQPSNLFFVSAQHAYACCSIHDSVKSFVPLLHSIYYYVIRRFCSAPV
jgi:hypothetical protein